MQKRLSCEGGTIADHRQRENADSVLIGAVEVRLSFVSRTSLQDDASGKKSSGSEVRLWEKSDFGRLPCISMESLAVLVRVRYFTATLHTTFTEAGHADLGGLGQSRAG